eukprot:362010-Chlamydomonas_euryale.AAC.3
MLMHVRAFMHAIVIRKTRLCCMHEGPVLALTLMRNLGRFTHAQNMVVSASGLGLSRLPRPRPRQE